MAKRLSFVALAFLGSTLLSTAMPEAATCRASFYGGGKGERLARHTANGEVFRSHGLTAAHRSLRFGTHVRVSRGGRAVVVRINDRGPAKWTGRCIDLSYGAARRLGMVGVGVAPVRLQVLK